MIPFIVHRSSLIAFFSSLAISAFAQPDTLWTRSFDYGADDYAVAALETDDGFVLASSTWNGNSISFGLTRTDAAGNELWARTYGDAENNWCSSIIETTDGGWLLGGFTFQPQSFLIDIFVVRVNTAGDTLWTRTIGGTNSSESANAMLALSDSGFLLAGDRDPNAQGFPDVYFLRLNGAGDTLWTRTFSNPTIESLSGVCRLTDGNYLACGSQFIEGGSTDFYFLKLTPAGDSLWTRAWGGDGYDLANEIVALPDGGAAFSGLTDSFGEEGDLFLGRLNSAGDTLWTGTYGADHEDHAHGLTPTSDGGFVIIGHTDSPPAVEGDIYAVKTDGEGNAQWVFTLAGADYESFESVRQTSDGGLILSGNHSALEFSDMFLMRLEDITSIDSDSDLILHPSSFILSAHPNPFNATTTVSFTLPRPAPVRLGVYDVTGRLVAIFLDAPLPAGSNELAVDAAAWPSGVYMVSLATQRSMATHKLLLLR